MTGTFFVALFMMVFMSMLSTAYQGIVVAKLPFHPVGFIQGITHRNLDGDDITDCSMIFVYILSNISLRPII
jgi:calcium load-activated calcium channel